MGTAPEVWPMLLLPDSAVEQGGARVLSWYHRGTMGSDRPADESRIELADHVADAPGRAGRRWGTALCRDGLVGRCDGGRRTGSQTSRARLRLMFVAGVPGDLFARCSARSGFRPCCAAR
ncbi:hypothetical protein [Kibdelosporangium philippinense]|uniref:hypothetical protein n=1 Tax=Kibdelosporangium philippinense TaxID=211113 RepID=UPI0036225046